MRDLNRALGVGACCGKCLPEAKKVLSNSLPASDAATSGMFVPALG